ncbi:MAG: cyclase family protein [Chloroflexi bacterium]|nr:cyclase family protein [Chloroflexota bacterium]
MAIEHLAHLHYRKTYDVTQSIAPGMVVWPGDPAVSAEPVKSLAAGDSSNVSLYRIGTHTGTHVDAPRHFLAEGDGVDRLDLALLMGRARLFQLPDASHIDRKTLESLDLNGVTRLLLGTRNSALLKQGRVERDYAYLTDDAAKYAVDLGIRLVGVDYLSIEQYKAEGHPTHRTLLGAGAAIIEGLDLGDVPPGDYELLCLPLKIKDGDGAPARVVLREM